MNELEKNSLTETPEVSVTKKAPTRKPTTAPAIKTAPVETTAEAISVPEYIDPVAARKAELKAIIARERAYKAQMVTGKFLFNECPGGLLEFSYLEFPGDKKVDYKMRHDTIHTIPLGVAMHLNDRVAYNEYSHNPDSRKTVEDKNLYIKSKVHRTSFIPLDFTMNAGYGAQGIVQASYVPIK